MKIIALHRFGFCSVRPWEPSLDELEKRFQDIDRLAQATGKADGELDEHMTQQLTGVTGGTILDLGTKKFVYTEKEDRYLLENYVKSVLFSLSSKAYSPPKDAVDEDI